jgi:hypothetical protein
MKLVPIRPPGSNARKARAFAAEIWQLRAQGYTFEAIREALAGAGVHVSNSTVQREVARAARRRPLAGPTADHSPIDRPAPPSPARVAPERPVNLQDASSPAVGLSGKEIAEAFVSTQSTNPLIRAKERR